MALLYLPLSASYRRPPQAVAPNVQTLVLVASHMGAHPSMSLQAVPRLQMRDCGRRAIDVARISRTFDWVKTSIASASIWGARCNDRGSMLRPCRSYC